MKNREIFKTIEKIEHNLKDSPKESIKLAETASNQIQTIKDENERASISFKLGKLFSNLTKFLKAIELYKQAQFIFEKSGDKVNIIQCYYHIGQNFLKANDFKEAAKYYTLALNGSSEMDDMKIHTNCLFSLGRICNELGNYDKALEFLFKSLKIFHSKNDSRAVAATLSNIGISFTDIRLLDKAIEHHLKAIEICEKTENCNFLPSMYNNIATTYQHSGNYEAALEYNFKSMNLRKRKNETKMISNSLNNIGEIYEKQKNYELALEYFLKAKKSAEKFSKYSLPVIYFNLAKIYVKLNTFDEVLKYLNAALELTEKTNVKATKLEVYQGAGEILFEFKDFQRAYEYLKKYYIIKDSMLSEEEAKKIEEDQFQKISDLQFFNDSDNKIEFPEIIGHSNEMKEVFSLINTVAEHNVNVMITGPTGTGKELVAKAIHNKYKKKSSFVAINCSAIPEHLLESELFGYAKGAFTGAEKNKKGKIEMANNGTLFLDEIGDMPFSLQSKMLRVIQERTVTPIGSTKSIPVSIRIISATHRDLNKMISDGEFRQDMFYRLNVIRIKIPALKDRKLDIPLLMNHFIRKYNKKFNKKIRAASVDAQNYLLSLPWQGNVRELENEIEKAVLLCEQEVLHIELFTDTSPKHSNNIFEKLPGKWIEYKSYKNKIINKLDSSYVKELLNSANNNVQEASEKGGLERAQIYRLMKKDNL